MFFSTDNTGINQLDLELLYLIVYSMSMEIFSISDVQYDDSYKLSVTIEHLKCGQCNWGTKV